MVQFAHFTLRKEKSWAAGSLLAQAGHQQDVKFHGQEESLRSEIRTQFHRPYSAPF